MRANDRTLQELSSLFFSMRQIIREKLPQGAPDPNTWLRFETLRFIAERGLPTMHDIAWRLRVQAPSATSLIRHLGSRGLIRRSRDPRDKRLVRVRLTRTGEKELLAYRERSADAMRKVFSKLPARDVAKLARVLRRLRAIHEPRGRGAAAQAKGVSRDTTRPSR